MGVWNPITVNPPPHKGLYLVTVVYTSTRTKFKDSGWNGVQISCGETKHTSCVVVISHWTGSKFEHDSHHSAVITHWMEMPDPAPQDD